MKRWLSILLLFFYLPFSNGMVLQAHDCISKSCGKAAGAHDAPAIPNECSEKEITTRVSVEHQVETLVKLIKKGNPQKGAARNTDAPLPGNHQPALLAYTSFNSPILRVPLYIRHCVYLL